jgi:predicted nuclease of restriction endonuclease-like RecB superfamily
MLVPEHIRVRRRKGVMTPIYASEEELGLAKTLVSVHRDAVERPRRELGEAVSGCEELGYDYRLVRGLASLLEERCTFESRAVIRPLKARKTVFGEAGRIVVATEEERNRLMANAAFRLGVSTLELEQSLYADLDNEQVLAGFEEPEPLDLLKEYNFALAVALVAHGKRLEVSYKGKDNGLVDAMGRLGESRVSSSGGVSRLVVEWRPSNRSGYRGALIEDILSRLLQLKGWALSVAVVYPLKVGRAYRLEIKGGVEGRMMSAGPQKEEELIPDVRRAHRKAPRTAPRPKARPSGGIVIVDDVARRMGITESEVRETYSGEGLLDIGGVLISREKRDEVLEALEGASDMRFASVRRFLRSLGVKQPVPVLEALGYVIDWNRDRGESLVYRLKRGG